MKAKAGRYAIVFTRVWKDARFRSLSADAKLLFLRLLTGDGCPLTNACVATPAELVEDLSLNRSRNGSDNGSRNRWRDGYADGLARLAEAVDEVADAGMAEFDLDAGIVWIPKAFRYDPPANPNIVKGWLRATLQLPESPVADRVIEHLRDHCVERGKGFAKLVEETVRLTVPGTVGVGVPETTNHHPPTINHQGITTPGETKSVRAREAVPGDGGGSRSESDHPGVPTLRRVWEIFQAVTGLDAGRAFGREEQRCLEVFRWARDRRGDDWLPEVRRAVEAFGRVDHASMKSPWAVFAASPGQWLDRELAARRGSGRGPVRPVTADELGEVEDVDAQLDRQLGVTR